MNFGSSSGSAAVAIIIQDGTVYQQMVKVVSWLYLYFS